MTHKKSRAPKPPKDTKYTFNGKGSRRFFDNHLSGDWTFEKYALHSAQDEDQADVRHKFLLDTDWLATQNISRETIAYIRRVQKYVKKMKNATESHVNTPAAGNSYVFNGHNNIVGNVRNASFTEKAGPSAAAPSTSGAAPFTSPTPEEVPSTPEEAPSTSTSEETLPAPVEDPTLYQQFLNRWMINCVKNSGYQLLRDRPSREAGSNKEALQKLSHTLLARFERNSLPEMCALRLSLSYIVSTVNIDIATVFKKSIGDSKWDGLVADEPAVDDLDPTIKTLIDDICKPLDERVPNAVRALIIINEKRLEQLRTMDQIDLKDPTPTLKLRVLDIYEYIINNVSRWGEMAENKEANENDFLSETHTIFNILLRGDVELIAKTGEVTATATKTARDYMKQHYDVDPASNVYGRKLDMLVARKKGYDLTAIEWKRKAIGDKQLLLQQCKNIRVNKCNLSAICNLPMLPENALDHYVLGMDWRGFCGYMFIVKKIHGVYIAKKIGSDMWLPTHLKLVSRFKETLQLLLFWKNHLNTLCQMIDVAIAVKDSAGMESIGGTSTLKRQRSDSDFTYMSPKRSR